MKHILLFTIIMLTVIFSTSAQEKFAIGAGTTFNHINHAGIDFTDQFGYYVGISTSDKYDDYIGSYANVQYTNRHVKGYSVHSINTSFCVQLYPTKEKTHIFTGFQIGFITSAKMGSESVDVTRAELGWVTGIGYEVTDRLKVIGRYDYLTSKKTFDWSAQLGVEFTL